MVVDWWNSTAWEGGGCRVISCPGALPGAGRNAGISEAENPWIAFLDAGIQPDAYWLEQLFRCLNQQSAIGLFGLCQFSADTPTTRAICALSYGCGSLLPVLPASIFNTEVFKQVGLFAADFRAGEDILWLNAYEKIYGPRKICLDAVVHYRHFPNDLRQAAKKWFTYEKHVVAAKIDRFSTAAHMLTLFTIIASVLISPAIGFSLLSIYAIARGIIDPIRRSPTWPWWGNFPKAIGIALLGGILLDVSKLAGYLAGLFLKRPPSV